ncbi:MAG: peptidoglycan DD-metalloendopeptidase family protein [Rubellimicrobium sp.]|nr:peptidoglycan DD-metalloendopeptidase family protein [Rubellimicrobium sp.]
MQPTLPAHSTARLGLAGSAALALMLAACGGEPLDTDLRGFSTGFSTTEAARAAAQRPAPDARGVITYPNSQVVVAGQGETVRTMAGRLGVSADEVARYNGIDPDAGLRTGELIALPRRIEGVPVAAGGTDITSLAGAAIDRAGTVTTQPLGPAAGGTAAASGGNGTPFGTASSEPVRHQVQRGETAYTIARLYNVPVADIAAWNGLGADLSVREGQQLLVPLTGGTPPSAPGATSQPGQGSPTPAPPSASTPLPAAAPPAATPAPAPAAPNLGSQQSAAPQARFTRPVSGAIIRAYAPGRNEGIDIGAAAGTEVRAADAGTVAAITTNTEGIKIVVIRHSDGLLTVYTHLDNLTVQKDSTVSRGQVIGRVRAGDPSFLHFEVRRGMNSLDPTSYLP